jgi:hypothetical protein
LPGWTAISSDQEPSLVGDSGRSDRGGEPTPVVPSGEHRREGCREAEHPEVDVLAEAVRADPVEHPLLELGGRVGRHHPHDLHALEQAPEMRIELPDVEVVPLFAPVGADAFVDVRPAEGGLREDADGRVLRIEDATVEPGLVAWLRGHGPPP